MNYYLIAPAVIVRQDQAAFTYHDEKELLPGTLVLVSVGKRIVTAVILKQVVKPKFKTKPITEILTPTPLPNQLIELAEWMSGYYATHLATTLQTVLPAGLHKTRRARKNPDHAPVRKRTNIVLNSDQIRAVETVTSVDSNTILLRGVTGSGKTEVYIEVAKKMQEAGKSSIILVPEIALTPQLVAEFANHFEDLVVTHSNMTEAERHVAWLRCLEASKPLIVVGPRSALFSPLTNLGLIVVDECHEPSFKQEQSPRYSALRAGSILAQSHRAKLILGSATPSVTDYFIATSTKNPVAEMNKPAIEAVMPAELTLIDQKMTQHFTNHRFLSNQLIKSIATSLASHKQSLLFHNRRGTAPSTLCSQCGWQAECPNCFVPLTLHADHHQLICHLCGYGDRVPTACPICRHPDVVFKGVGTKLIETEVKKLFSKAIVARFDADNRPGETLHANYQKLYDGDIDIVIGTQLLAKGLDLPNLSTVGVVQADSGLMIPDYQAEERVFQLLYQVAGRVGRRAHESQVIVQTYQPDHPAIQFALSRDYLGFYESQISQRKRSQFPPFTYLLKLTCAYATEEGAVKAGRTLATALRNKFSGLQILGPTPAFHERLGGRYRWQIIVKSKQRSQLLHVIKQVPSRAWQFDIDPANLL